MSRKPLGAELLDDLGHTVAGFVLGPAAAFVLPWQYGPALLLPLAALRELYQSRRKHPDWSWWEHVVEIPSSDSRIRDLGGFLFGWWLWLLLSQPWMPTSCSLT